MKYTNHAVSHMVIDSCMINSCSILGCELSRVFLPNQTAISVSKIYRRHSLLWCMLNKRANFNLLKKSTLNITCEGNKLHL